MTNRATKSAKKSSSKENTRRPIGMPRTRRPTTAATIEMRNWLIVHADELVHAAPRQLGRAIRQAALFALRHDFGFQ